MIQSDATQFSTAFLEKSFQVSRFSVATLTYDFGFAKLEGYAELGCKLTYQDTSVHVDSELRVNDGAVSVGGNPALRDGRRRR